MDKNILESLINENISIAKIANKLHASKTKIRYWLKKFNLKTNVKIQKFDWSEINILKGINNAECRSDIMRNLNIPLTSGNFETLKKYLKIYDLDISNLKKTYNGNNFIKIENSDIFKKGSNITRGSVKYNIIKQNLIKYECAICNNNGLWNDQKLSLHLDHINGINDDNRLENLRFLCPNCHSQTPTYGGKKFKRIYLCKCGKEMAKKSKVCNNCIKYEPRKSKVENKPSVNILVEEVKKLGYRAIGKKYGVSDNAVKKWLGDKKVIFRKRKF